MRVLLTAFEPNDDGINASELIVKSIRDDPPLELAEYIDCIDFAIMPGDTNVLGDVLYETLSTYSPNICILTGQAPGRNKITLERMATNLKYFVTLDKMKNAPKGDKVVQDGPAAYWTTLPGLEYLISLLQNQRIPAAISNNCGTHLCNQVFYHALNYGAVSFHKMKSGFVHIPALPEQVIESWPESPFMPIEMSRQALALIIKSSIT